MEICIIAIEVYIIIITNLYFKILELWCRTKVKLIISGGPEFNVNVNLGQSTHDLVPIT